MYNLLVFSKCLLEMYSLLDPRSFSLHTKETHQLPPAFGTHVLSLGLPILDIYQWNHVTRVSVVSVIHHNVSKVRCVTGVSALHS